MSGGNRLWDKIEAEIWHGQDNRNDYYRGDRIIHSKISEFFDNEVSPDDVIDVDKVVGEILSHPHRKHFGTLDLPNDKTRAEHEGIFKMGVPENVLYSFGHWFRMSWPLEKAREKYLICKENGPKYPTPKDCMEEAKEVFDLYAHLSEIPFRACPDEAADYTYCVDTRGTQKSSWEPYSRSFASFIRFCRPEQEAFQACMEKKFDAKFPPTPEKHTYYPRSCRYTNLPWDKIYS
jgi:hypothetical protein